MKGATFALALAVLALPGLALGVDTWTTLADVPFTYGVSAGGGLATDGTYLYAADFPERCLQARGRARPRRRRRTGGLHEPGQ